MSHVNFLRKTRKINYSVIICNYFSNLVQVNFCQFSLPQIVELSKKITREANETVALKKIKAILESEDQFHGSKKFPENESNSEAHARCVDDVSAKKHCPTRWKSIQRWAKVSFDSLLSGCTSSERTKMLAKQNLWHFQLCTVEAVWALELVLNISFKNFFVLYLLYYIKPH